MSTTPRRYPVNPQFLKVGAPLETSIYDADGIMLLAKGQRIVDQSLLSSIRARGDLFAYELNTNHTVNIRSGFEAAVLANAPLNKIDEFAQQRAQVNLDRSSPRQRAATVTVEAPLPQIWTELEFGLRTALANLAQTHDAAVLAVHRLKELASRLEVLLEKDREASLFVLLHRAVTGFAGYSAHHALVCATLAKDAATRLPVSPSETRTLIMACLTMNVSIRVLQDQLATQKSPLTQDQLLAIDRHGIDSANALRALVQDELWLDVVERHHEEMPACAAINDRPVADKLIKVLQVIDRYTASLSPRGSRAGRDPREAAKSVIRQYGQTEHDEVGVDLMQNLGLFPPGTYVRLANQAEAVVLKSGGKPNTPWVVPVTNKSGDALASFKAIETVDAEHMVVQGLPGTSMKVRIDEALMIKLLRSLALSEASKK